MSNNTSVLQLMNQPSPVVPDKAKARAERLRQVEILVAAGKSNRAIARRLGCDEGTVRNDRKILTLPAAEIRSVMNGVAGTPLLREQQARETALGRQKQEIAEQKSQFLTNRLAELMRAWLDKFPLLPSDKLHILAGVDRWSWDHGTTSAIFIPDSKIKGAIESAKPRAGQPQEIFTLIEWLKVWLFAWITRIEPDKAVRNRALAKLRQAVERQHGGW